MEILKIRAKIAEISPYAETLQLFLIAVGLFLRSMLSERQRFPGENDNEFRQDFSR